MQDSVKLISYFNLEKNALFCENVPDTPIYYFPGTDPEYVQESVDAWKKLNPEFQSKVINRGGNIYLTNQYLGYEHAQSDTFARKLGGISVPGSPYALRSSQLVLGYSKVPYICFSSGQELSENDEKLFLRDLNTNETLGNTIQDDTEKIEKGELDPSIFTVETFLWHELGHFFDTVIAAYEAKDGEVFPETATDDLFQTKDGVLTYNQYQLSSTEEFSALYDKYSEAMREIDSSAKINIYATYEMFAEAFRMCAQKPEVLAERVPEVYAYMDKVVQKYFGCHANELNVENIKNKDNVRPIFIPNEEQLRAIKSVTELLKSMGSGEEVTILRDGCLNFKPIDIMEEAKKILGDNIKKDLELSQFWENACAYIRLNHSEALSNRYLKDPNYEAKTSAKRRLEVVLSKEKLLSYRSVTRRKTESRDVTFKAAKSQMKDKFVKCITEHNSGGLSLEYEKYFETAYAICKTTPLNIESAGDKIKGLIGKEGYFVDQYFNPVRIVIANDPSDPYHKNVYSCLKDVEMSGKFSPEQVETLKTQLSKSIGTDVHNRTDTAINQEVFEKLFPGVDYSLLSAPKEPSLMEQVSEMLEKKNNQIYNINFGDELTSETMDIVASASVIYREADEILHNYRVPRRNHEEYAEFRKAATALESLKTTLGVVSSNDNNRINQSIAIQGLDTSVHSIDFMQKLNDDGRLAEEGITDIVNAYSMAAAAGISIQFIDEFAKSSDIGAQESDLDIRDNAQNIINETHDAIEI